jgi:putative endonuclease
VLVDAFDPRRLGALGERRAAWYYRLRGYRILFRNLRLGRGEIDLVAKRGRTIAIVEVKTRQTVSAGEGYEAVNRRKREQLIRLAEGIARDYPEAMLRYDVMSLFWTGWYFRITCYRDAFRPVADARFPWLWRA